VLAVKPTRVKASPPLSHPSHIYFLVDLYSRWIFSVSTSTSLPHSSDTERSLNGPLFSRMDFVGELVDALLEHGSIDSWTCKAMARFAREMREHDVCSYAELCVAITEMITRPRSRARNQQKVQRNRSKTDLSVSEDLDTELHERLARWLEAIPDDCFAAEGSNYDAILRILSAVHASGLQTLGEPALVDSPARMLQSALVCAGTRCIHSPAFASCSSRARKDLLEFLRSIPPGTASFDALIDSIFLAQLHDSKLPESSDNRSLDGIMSSLEAYALALRSYSFSVLEASFWSCALRYFERYDMASRMNTDWRMTSEFRSRLMDARGVAEAARQVDDGDEWEWEEMLGCWVRKSLSKSSLWPEQVCSAPVSRLTSPSRVRDPHVIPARQSTPRKLARVVLRKRISRTESLDSIHANRTHKTIPKQKEDETQRARVPSRRFTFAASLDSKVSSWQTPDSHKSAAHSGPTSGGSSRSTTTLASLFEDVHSFQESDATSVPTDTSSDEGSVYEDDGVYESDDYLPLPLSSRRRKMRRACVPSPEMTPLKTRRSVSGQGEKTMLPAFRPILAEAARSCIRLHDGRTPSSPRVKRRRLVDRKLDSESDYDKSSAEETSSMQYLYVRDFKRSYSSENDSDTKQAARLTRRLSCSKDGMKSTKVSPRQATMLGDDVLDLFMYSDI
jgi:hypothetical protein